MMADHDRGSRPGTGQDPLPPTAVFTRSFRACASGVRETLITIDGRMRPHISADLMGRAGLVLAELLNNVAQHGRKGPGGPDPMVHLSVVLRPEGLACAASDDGGLLPRICLNTSSPPCGDVPVQSLPEGGFGWFLIGHLTQSLTHFREGDRNFVAFTIPAEPATGAEATPERTPDMAP
ncbi:MAG: ATP-binding protein [Paracoccus sp. (in: a-proteobacteria)]|nr:ATP-binding protein [Paracoccus sp. (in: a-proteobacteria)]